MQYLATREEVAAAAAALDHSSEAPAALAQATLAWYLREDDPPRAERVAAAVLAACAPAHVGWSIERELAAARATLVKAYVCFLANELQAAQQLLAEAQQRFERPRDPLGLGDTHLLAGYVVEALGDHAARDEHRRSAMSLYEECGDALRQRVVQLVHATDVGMRDGVRAEQLLREVERDAGPIAHPVLLMHAASVRALCRLQAGRPVEALAHFQDAHAHGVVSGELRRAVVSAMNVATIYFGLGDYGATLEWSECALAISRPRRMHRLTAHALVLTANTMRVLHRLADARELMVEAERLSPQDGSHSRARALRLEVSAQIAHDSGELERALEEWETGLAIADRLQADELRATYLRGRAATLSRLGRVQEAMDDAFEALGLFEALGAGVQRANVLHVLSRISAEHGLPTPAGSRSPTAAVHYLQAALEAVQPALPDSTWHAELSVEYERLGDFPRALQAQRDAECARERAHLQQTERVATVMRVRHETEFARAEAVHQQALARAEGRRAQAETQAERAKAAFLANTSHELRSPLNAMLGFVRIVEARLADGPHGEDLRLVRRNAEELQALVNHLLDRSRCEFEAGRQGAGAGRTSHA